MKKKSFLCPFLSAFVFVACVDTLTFFCPLWLFTNQRERRDVFIHTHTRTEEERLLRELLQRERERKKKEHGEERGTTLCFVSIQQKRKSKEDFCFKRDDEERSFFFNLLVPGGTLVLRG